MYRNLGEFSCFEGLVLAERFCAILLDPTFYVTAQSASVITLSSQDVQAIDYPIGATLQSERPPRARMQCDPYLQRIRVQR